MSIMSAEAPPKLDRRIVRTRTALREALIALIQEKGFESISIHEIADRANVNRATFYLHYRDKEDLLTRSMQDVYQDLVYQSEQIDQLDGHYAGDVVVFNHVRDYIGFYKVMLGSKGVASYMHTILTFIANVSIAPLQSLEMIQQGKPNSDLVATAYVYAGAIMGFIKWWVEHDMPYPPKQAALVAQGLAIFGCSWGLNWDLSVLPKPQPNPQPTDAPCE
jgi:AcrR family transcriptional regulator